VLKSTSNFIGRLFNKRCSHKIRKDAYWTDIYPSPEPSLLRKTINTTGNWFYNCIDNFFRGSANGKIGVFEFNDFTSEKVSSIQIEWELNQDIIDIAFIDIRSSLSWILPAFLKKFAIRLHQLTFLYLFTDLVNDEENQEWIELKNKNFIRHEPDKSRVIYTIEDLKNRIGARCLSLNDWLRNTYSRFKLFLRPEQHRETYYLLGYFAPRGYEDPHDDQNYMIRGPDKVKLNPAFSFHKRI
jgi:hypothetical protein